MRRNPALVLVALLLAPLALAGCGTDKPTRLYKLSPVAENAEGTSPRGVAIGVGPITLPKYLDRPQIVTGVTSNQMSQGNFDQWGGELNDNMTRVLAANLSNLLGTDRVSLYPWKDQAPIEYQVTLDVTQFEQEASGKTVLSAFWSVVNPNTGKVLTMRRSTYRDATTAAPTAGSAATTADSTGADPYDAVAAAMSRDLGALSRDIARTITALHGS